MSQTDRRELGNTDSPIEDELEDAFNRTVDEGAQRLHRPWREILVTGFFGGTEVAIGVLALIAVRAATGSPLLAGAGLLDRFPRPAARPQRAVHRGVHGAGDHRQCPPGQHPAVADRLCGRDAARRPGGGHSTWTPVIGARHHRHGPAGSRAALPHLDGTLGDRRTRTGPTRRTDVRAEAPPAPEHADLPGGRCLARRVVEQPARRRRAVTAPPLDGRRPGGRGCRRPEPGPRHRSRHGGHTAGRRRHSWRSRGRPP